MLKSDIPKEKKQILLSLRFSGYQKHRIKELKKRWAKESRGVKGRLRKGIELAVLYKCDFKLYGQEDK